MKKIITAQLPIFVFILLASIFSNAQEDILLIDVNNVVPEIDQIQKFIASERKNGREQNTNLVIVPSLKRLSMEKRRKINNIYETEINSSQHYYETQCTDSQTKSNPQKLATCDNKLETMKSARTKITNLIYGPKSDSTNSFDTEKLQINDVLQDLDTALKGPYKFNRVIISGHHFPGDVSDSRRLLSGELFTGFSSEIAQKYLNAATSTANVRSVMLFGCWTGGPDALKNYWGNVLPQANLHSGFISPAPIKYSTENLNILTSFLKNEKSLGESKTQVEAEQNLSLIYKGNRQLGLLIKSWYLKK